MQPFDLTLEDIRAAAVRIAAHAHVTPVLRSDALDAATGASLHFKAEHLQRGGAFKLRGALNAVWALDDATAARGVVTHSSGNHGNALALAARSRGIPAHVVVPDGAVRTKVAAIAAAGATLHRCAPTQAAREAAAAAVQASTGATLVHPYADPYVVAGQGTAALELLRQVPDLDAIVVPIGGGGLTAGTAIVARTLRPSMDVHAAEPEGAADAWLSMQRGERVTDVVPDTVCDGLRATLGAPNFEILRRLGVEVLPVSDTETLAAMRRLWADLKQVVEPSSATVLAAVLRHRQHYAGRRVGLILSGGNVDLDAIAFCARCGAAG